MSCNCNSDHGMVTRDLRQMVAAVTSKTGVAAGEDVGALGILSEQDDIALHLDPHSPVNQLESRSIKRAEGAETRTFKGFLDGFEFDYDISFELKGSVVEVTLILRKPFQFSVTLEVDLRTRRWEVKKGSVSGASEISVQADVGVLGCGKWCIIRCLGWSAVKCIGCGPVWPCWIGCLKNDSPRVALCIARCCS